MKKFLTYGLLMLMAATGCRKEKARVLPENAELKPSHCFNEVKDGDEMYVDCGGSCEACNILTVPCSTTANTDSLQYYGVQTFNTINCGIVSGKYQVKASNSTVTVTMDFNTSTITPNQIYNIPTGSLYYDNDVLVEVNIGLYDYSAGGYIYCTEKNGKYSFDFCNIRISTFQFAPYQSLYMTGNITCN